MLSRNRIKYIQSLTRKKGRDIHRSFIAETPKVVNEFLNSSYKAEFLFAEERWLSENPAWSEKNPSIEAVREDDLKKISQLKTPHGVLAVLKMPDPNPNPVTEGQISIALDDLQDPGNMGTLLRIADWFGIKNVFCSLETADIYNPKVVQASMGSLAHISVTYLPLEDFLKNSRQPVYATTMEGTSIYEHSGIKEGILIIGNEGKGISDSVLALANKRLTIPRIGKAESLNAAVATGIILSHLTKG